MNAVALWCDGVMVTCPEERTRGLFMAAAITGVEFYVPVFPASLCTTKPIRPVLELVGLL